MRSMLSTLTCTTVTIALLFAPQFASAQLVPPAPLLTSIRGCDLVLHARNTGNVVVTVELNASQAQEGTKAWGTIDGGAVNHSSAMTFTLPANATTTRHSFSTWISCDEKQRYRFSVRRGSRAPVMIEFPAGGAYTTDKSLRLGDLAGKP